MAPPLCPSPSLSPPPPPLAAPFTNPAQPARAPRCIALVCWTRVFLKEQELFSLTLCLEGSDCPGLLGIRGFQTWEVSGAEREGDPHLGSSLNPVSSHPASWGGGGGRVTPTLTQTGGSAVGVEGVQPKKGGFQKARPRRHLY